MKRKSKAPPFDGPEFIVTRGFFNRFFDKPIPPATFFYRLKERTFVRWPVQEGRYLLNASLVRLGLPPLRELPAETEGPSSEDILRLGFSFIDPGLFPGPSWLLTAEVVGERDLSQAQGLADQHRDAVRGLDHPKLQIAYFQGVLDAVALVGGERQFRWN